MEFDLFILPLAGGFLLASYFNLSSYSVARSDSQRLIFYSVLGGVFLVIVAVILRALLGLLLDFPAVRALRDHWHAIAPFDYSATVFFAFLLTFPCIVLGNRIWTRDKALRAAIEEAGDPLERLLWRAFDGRKLVAISVSNGKVYVGYIATTMNPSLPVDTIGLIPQISGYRDEATKVFVPTNSYIGSYLRILDAIQQRIDDAERRKGAGLTLQERIILELIAGDEEGLNDFQLVIPIACIQSVAQFDFRIYEEQIHPVVLDVDQK